jgi:predicted nuclease of predicted toxin-antitoxin system
MKLSEFGLLTDENIDPEVADWLTAAGFNVFDVKQANLQGTADVDLMRRAVVENRVIVTHDADFGTLAILQGEPVIGLLFIRPSHLDPQFTIGTLEAVIKAQPEVIPPFIIVARRNADNVAIRIRQLAP